MYEAVLLFFKQAKTIQEFGLNGKREKP